MSPGSQKPWRGHFARSLWIPAALALTITSCRPASAPPPSRSTPLPPASAVVLPQAEAPPAVTPATAPAGPRVVSWSARGVSFEGVAFDARSHRLVVVDQPDGPGSKHATAAHAARSNGGIAAVNAGFFTPTGQPLGLVVSRGNPAGQWNAGSSLGSGVWHETSDGGARIVRRESIGAAAARRMAELLQSGPMLVENGQPVKGLRGGEPRPRTLIAWDGQHRWWIGCTAPCTMPALATALASGSGPGFRVRTALNLDGGRSSELWIAGAVTGGPLTRRPIWNRAVRNHLVLVRR